MYNTVFCVFMRNDKTCSEVLANVFSTREKAENYVNESLHNDQLMGWENYSYRICEIMVH